MSQVGVLTVCHIVGVLTVCHIVGVLTVCHIVGVLTVCHTGSLGRLVGGCCWCSLIAAGRSEVLGSGWWSMVSPSSAWWCVCLARVGGNLHSPQRSELESCPKSRPVKVDAILITSASAAYIQSTWSTSVTLGQWFMDARKARGFQRASLVPLYLFCWLVA